MSHARDQKRITDDAERAPALELKTPLLASEAKLFHAIDMPKEYKAPSRLIRTNQTLQRLNQQEEDIESNLSFIRTRRWRQRMPWLIIGGGALIGLGIFIYLDQKKQLQFKQFAVDFADQLSTLIKSRTSDYEEKQNIIEKINDSKKWINIYQTRVNTTNSNFSCVRADPYASYHNTSLSCNSRLLLVPEHHYCGDWNLNEPGFRQSVCSQPGFELSTYHDAWDGRELIDYCHNQIGELCITIFENFTLTSQLVSINSRITNETSQIDELNANMDYRTGFMMVLIDVLYGLGILPLSAIMTIALLTMCSNRFARLTQTFNDCMVFPFRSCSFFQIRPNEQDILERKAEEHFVDRNFELPFTVAMHQGFEQALARTKEEQREEKRRQAERSAQKVMFLMGKKSQYATNLTLFESPLRSNDALHLIFDFAGLSEEIISPVRQETQENVLREEKQEASFRMTIEL